MNVCFPSKIAAAVALTSVVGLGPAEGRVGRPKTTPAPSTTPTAGSQQGTTTKRSTSPATPAHAGGTVEIAGARFEFVTVPAGSVTIGSTNGERDEKNTHQATFSRPFEMMKYEVTQGEWEALMRTNPSERKGADLPVTNVSWDDAQYFVTEINRLDTTHVYRLPTEAEWEYACRAGTSGDWAGNLDSMAWYADNSGDAHLDATSLWANDQSNYGSKVLANGCRVHPVGLKKSNAWGLYDMHGSVWEWCADWYGAYPTGSVTDPKGPSTGSFRVIRGGSWDSTAAGCRSANRASFAPGDGDAILGFRLVRTSR